MTDQPSLDAATRTLRQQREDALRLSSYRLAVGIGMGFGFTFGVAIAWLLLKAWSPLCV